MNEKDIIKQMHDEAKRLGVCNLFTGFETLEQLCYLLKSNQARRWCVYNHFPSIESARMLKPFNLERYGCYVDCGKITANNDHITLAGDTEATLNYSEKRVFRLNLMYGAKAILNISNGARVWVINDETSAFKSNIKDGEVYRNGTR